MIAKMVKNSQKMKINKWTDYWEVDIDTMECKHITYENAKN
tara:strand:- start:71 stop:193 length:123 start_codon:yes stop_codon:yes gene_type:complete